MWSFNVSTMASGVIVNMVDCPDCKKPMKLLSKESKPEWDEEDWACESCGCAEYIRTNQKRAVDAGHN